jgi:hypothetical protein
MILARNGPGHLKFGVTKQLSQELEVPDRVLRRIWKNGLGGIGNVVNKKAGRCGRKRVELDAASLVAIPLPQRTTLRDVAANLNMSLTTVHARLQQKEFRHRTSDLKPDLTLANLKARIQYCLDNLEPHSLPDDPTFKAMFNVVHIDEKWFYRTRKSQGFYMGNNEENPKRSTRNKNYIEKIMFLAAVARPRFDSDGNCTFDGKIGIQI